MAKISSYKKRVSDRSGFDEYEDQLIRDKGFLVAGDEYDTPPPSNLSIGGEGEVSGDPRSNSDFTIANTATPASNDHPTFYITAVAGITPDFNHSWMNVTGSNSAVVNSANPRISRGTEGQKLTLFCTDSSITLNHGNGLNLMGSSMCVLNSGDSITFYYTSGGTVWNETSRFRR